MLMILNLNQIPVAAYTKLILKVILGQSLNETIFLIYLLILD